MATNASVIVTRFSQEKFPLSTSHSCVPIMMAAPIPATGCGANSAKGATS